VTREREREREILNMSEERVDGELTRGKSSVFEYNAVLFEVKATRRAQLSRSQRNSANGSCCYCRRHMQIRHHSESFVEKDNRRKRKSRSSHTSLLESMLTSHLPIDPLLVAHHLAASFLPPSLCHPHTTSLLPFFYTYATVCFRTPPYGTTSQEEKAQSCA
jgi:hypothetical protein